MTKAEAAVIKAVLADQRVGRGNNMCYPCFVCGRWCGPGRRVHEPTCVVRTLILARLAAKKKRKK